MKTERKVLIYKTVITVLIFWVLDFIFHQLGVGESTFYFSSKLGNAILFSIIWFFVFNSKVWWNRLVYAVVFGTYISLYYLVFSYSGLVQLLGITARYTPPPFVLFGYYLTPVLWWFFHIAAFYLGLELARLIKVKK